MRPEEITLPTQSDMELLAHFKTSYRMATELMEITTQRFRCLTDRCENRINREPPFKKSDKGTINTCSHEANKAGECHIICCPLEEEESD